MSKRLDVNGVALKCGFRFVQFGPVVGQMFLQPGVPLTVPFPMQRVDTPLGRIHARCVERCGQNHRSPGDTL